MRHHRTRRRLGIFAWLIIPALAVCSAQQGLTAVAGYEFLIPDVDAAPGAEFQLAVQGAHVESIQGFSLALDFPADSITVDRVQYVDTILDAIGTDFFEVYIDPAEGFLTIGCLADAHPPFEGQVIPSIGRPLDFFYVEGQVSSDAIEDISFELADGLSAPGSPPVENVFVVDDLPIEASSAGGFIRLPFEELPLFMRGDVTLDTAVDMTDAISLLDFLFRGGPEPGCFDSADANDDRVVDMSDSIFLLGFLFVGSESPPPPSHEIGADPTFDALGCREPIDVRRVLAGQ